MCKIVVVKNVLDRNHDELHDVKGSLLEWMFDYYEGKLPDGVRCYHNNVDEASDVTPRDFAIESDLEKFERLNGTIYTVEYPKFGPILAAILFVAAVGVVQFLLQPKPPQPRDKRQNSANNGLSELSLIHI